LGFDCKDGGGDATCERQGREYAERRFHSFTSYLGAALLPLLINATVGSKNWQAGKIILSVYPTLSGSIRKVYEKASAK